MTIGALRKQISIQAEQQTPDGAGGYTLGWTTVATTWADITPVSGNEVFAAGHLEGRVTHKITLRWRGEGTITTAMRILYGTRVFNIHSVMNANEGNRWALVLAEEGGAV